MDVFWLVAAGAVAPVLVYALVRRVAESMGGERRVDVARRRPVRSGVRHDEAGDADGVTCPRCGVANGEEFDFCRNCSTRLPRSGGG